MTKECWCCPVQACSSFP